MRHAKDVPLPDAKRMAHLVDVFNRDRRSEIEKIYPCRHRLRPAGQEHAMAPGPRLRFRPGCDGGKGIHHGLSEVRAEIGLRPSGSPLIDQNEVAARCIRMRRLIAGIDGQRAAETAADMKRRGTSYDDDGQREPSGAWVV